MGHTLEGVCMTFESMVMTYCVYYGISHIIDKIKVNNMKITYDVIFNEAELLLTTQVNLLLKRYIHVSRQYKPVVFFFY